MGFFDTLNQIKNTVDEVKGMSASFMPGKALHDTKGNTVNTSLFTSYYDLSKLREFQKYYYKITGSNIDRAKADIIYLNLYLEHALVCYPRFPKKKIDARKLNFDGNNPNYNDFCFLNFNPLTKTGKVPKYPVCLSFHYDKELFGTIFYGQSGEIDRAEITAWSNNVCHELILTLANGVIDIDKIYKYNSVTGEKQKMYSK